MFRTRTTIATLVLAISPLMLSPLALSAAQAETSTLATQVHAAAVTACAPERATGMLPHSHYDVIANECVYRLSHSAMAKYEALAAAKSDQSMRLASK